MTKKIVLYFVCLLFCLLLYYQGGQDLILVIIVTIFTCLLLAYNMLTIYNGRFTLSSALLAYIIIGQFGLFIPFAFGGYDVLSGYRDSTLLFLTSTYLGPSILLGDIAVLFYDISRIICLRMYTSKQRLQKFVYQEKGMQFVYSISIILIGILLLFFIYHVLTGGMKLFASYHEFMSSSAYNSPFYNYLLVVFYVGTLYLAVSGNVPNRLLGWLVWFMVVVIFAMNGNKGEFLYSLLAVFGLKGTIGQKLSKKMIIGIAAILFFIIPSITALREVGVTRNIQNASGSSLAAFAEMGMQIRTTVYTLDNLSDGSFEYLYGRSYWQPIVNILTPFSSHVSATEKVRETLDTMGYNQVAESYLNFGLIGVIVFFSLMGWILCRYENKCKTLLGLGFWASVTCVLINGNRNYFAFVPGQILIMSFFYYLFKFGITIRDTSNTKILTHETR